MAYLDERPLLEQEIRYGSLGLSGNLGYEDQEVRVLGRSYSHAISAHAPSRLRFDLNGGYIGLHCQVALNDDVPIGAASADFSVFGDGRLLALAQAVAPGQIPRALDVDVRGVQQLELIVSTHSWVYCHSVWLDPRVDAEVGSAITTLIDCLESTQIVLPSEPIRAQRCIATVVSLGYTDLLDDMLGSLAANGQCQDAVVVVFAVAPDTECRRVAAKYGAHLIVCLPLAETRPTVKSILYSVARVVDAQQFLCLDADTLVLGDLRPLFAAQDACRQGSILAAPDPFVRGGSGNLLDSLCGFYQGTPQDIALLLGRVGQEGAYSLIVNDGVFAGDRLGLLALDLQVRAMLPYSLQWIANIPGHGARNQFLFNLALATLDCGVALDPTWNLLTGLYELERQESQQRVQAFWQGREVRILHFAGSGRQNQQEWGGRYSRIEKPLVGRGGGDGYACFLTALRAWIGRHGLPVLAWSFQGASNASDAYVRDRDNFPLLATLHYLIRANGCERVLEAGTGRGVSTACLAAAVAHRKVGKVVTLDHCVAAERADLWAGLPERMQECIEARLTDSLAGMEAASEAGERYQAALLDSSHEGSYVWEEFQKVASLVCEGGLILIHDVRYLGGTVEQALKQIEAAGYGVVRLWTAVEGICEDDHLGLAVIENRKRL